MSNFKNKLQEYLQKRRLALPKYNTWGEVDRNNIHHFTSEVTVGDQTFRSNGKHKTKKQAEQGAAEEACKELIDKPDQVPTDTDKPITVPESNPTPTKKTGNNLFIVQL